MLRAKRRSADFPLAAKGAAQYRLTGLYQRRMATGIGKGVGDMTTQLDRTHAAMTAGGDAEGMAFYRALADAELFILLEAEAEGEVMTPRIFDLADGPVLLAFDNEERLAGFSDQVLPYAALPGRIVAAQMVGQGLSLGLNLGSGAASEVILPPEALDWLMAMLDQAPAQASQAQVARFEPPAVPVQVLDALATGLAGVGRTYVVGAVYDGGRRGQMLVLVGVAASAEAALLRAVTEALAFSGLDASALDTVFLAEDDGALARLAGPALMLQGDVVEVEEVPRVGPGMDPARPPNLK